MDDGYMKFLQDPVYKVENVYKERLPDNSYETYYVLSYEGEEMQYGSTFKFVAQIGHEGEQYLILLPRDPAEFSSEYLTLADDAAFVFRLTEDKTFAERIFDFALTTAVFEKYRAAYPEPHVQDVFEFLLENTPEDSPELKMEYVSEPGDGTIILRNHEGRELRFPVVVSVPYRGALYLIVGLDEEIAETLGTPENGVLVFRWGTGRGTKELHYIIDPEIVEAVVGIYNKHILSE